MTLTVGSLFSGIGGIDLGLERAGMTVLWQSEIEPYACRVLAKHWPTVPNLGDIRTVNWETVPYVDVIAGGYPCQPFSLAGSRQGADDPRHLWPCFADAICRVRPRFALLENVAAHLTLGFGTVLADLAALGYDARWDCIPAAAVGAPHLRDRVFVIATRRNGSHADTDSEPGRPVDGEIQGIRPRPERGRDVADTDNGRALHAFRTGWDAPWDGGPAMADTDSVAGTTGDSRSGRSGTIPESGTEQRTLRRGGVHGTPLPDPDYPRSQGRSGSSGTGRQDSDGHLRPCSGWPPEPDVGRVAHGVPRRMDRLRGLGNAVVPQVAEHLGWIIRSIA